LPPGNKKARVSGRGTLQHGRKNVRCFLSLFSVLRAILQKYGRIFGHNPCKQKARTKAGFV
jgi:hypothetical protein